MPVEEAPDRANARWYADLCELRLDLSQRDVRLLFDETEDQSCVSLDARRAPVTSKGTV